MPKGLLRENGESTDCYIYFKVETAISGECLISARHIMWSIDAELGNSVDCKAEPIIWDMSEPMRLLIHGSTTEQFLQLQPHVKGTSKEHAPYFYRTFDYKVTRSTSVPAFISAYPYRRRVQA